MKRLILPLLFLVTIARAAQPTPTLNAVNINATGTITSGGLATLQSAIVTSQNASTATCFDGGVHLVNCTSAQSLAIGSVTGATGAWSGPQTISNATASTTPITGALQVAGGVGISGSLFSAGSLHSASGTSVVSGLLISGFATANSAACGDSGSNIVTCTSSQNMIIGSVTGATGNWSGPQVISNSTASTTPITGALQVAGGVGVSGALFVAGNSKIVNASGNVSLAIQGPSSFLQLLNSPSSGSKNYSINHNNNTGGFAISLSSANDGTTFSNDLLTFQQNGAMAITGTLSAPGIGTSTAALSYTCWNSSTGAFTGDSSGTCLVSLKNSKENVEDLRDGLAEIMALHPVSFDYKPEFNPNHLPRQVGFIAEEVEAVDRRIAGYDTKSGKLQAVSYQTITAPLVKAVQEQQAEIEELRKEINLLKRKRK